jgi:hypothetical protein
MRTFCLSKGISVDQWITEIAGFITFKLPKFLALITEYVAKSRIFTLHIKFY